MKDNTTSTAGISYHVVEGLGEISLTETEEALLLLLGRRVKAGDGFGMLRRKGKALRIEHCKIARAYTG